MLGRVLGILLAIALTSAGWAQEKRLPPPVDREIDFTRDVDPIFERKCYVCHGLESAMNGYSLWRQTEAMRGGHSGLAAIVEGDSAGSRMIQLVAGLEENLLMPPAGGKLTDEEIGILRAWIDQGVEWGPGREEAEQAPTYEWLDMDYGPVISASITVRGPEDPRADKGPEVNVAYKAHAIALTEEKDAAVLFDTELLRYAAGWNGGFLVLTGTVFDWSHGPHPYAAGKPAFETPVAPGWAKGGSFADPRESGFGPLPRDWAKYRGRYVHGEKTVLSYTVGGTGVLDLPAYERTKEAGIFVRSMEIGPSAHELILAVANDSTAIVEPLGKMENGVRLGDLAAAVQGGGASWTIGESDNLRLRIPPSTETRVVEVYLTIGGGSSFSAWIAAREVVNPAVFTRDAPARFQETLQTEGKLGTGSGPWVVDEITLPMENPWQSWMRPGDFAFFDDDRAAMTTWSGDVWIVSGVDEDLDELTWKRYATGFNQPLGAEVVDGVVYVLDRNQVTRLHDLNGDGEADFYENFNNDFEATHHFHEFTFDLDRDAQGNFYFAKAARHALPAKVKHHGTIMKLAPDGRDLQVLCRGFRVPNGVAVSPTGQVTTSDQEGHWIPSTPIAWCAPGTYHGYAWGGGVDPEHADDYERPVTYIPINVDNSGAGQAWVPDERWGPFPRQLIHSSFGRGKIFLVMIEQTSGWVQGGAYALPVEFDTGLMRPDFRASDGQLYLCGLKGWGTVKKATGGFYRVRYTGRAVTLPRELHVNAADGVAITFTAPLDAVAAANPANYDLRRWNYQRTSTYGSDNYRLDGEVGLETVAIRGVRVSDDRKTVFLDVEDLRPVDQMQVDLNIRGADGKAVAVELSFTVNKVETERGPEVLAESAAGDR